MKQFQTKTKDGLKVDFNFPTTIDEISDEYLKDVTSSIKVADNYVLAGLVYTEKLSTLIMTAKRNNKNTKIKVTPIFIKAGKSEVDYINNAKIKDRIIGAPTAISLGIHVNAPGNRLTIDYLAAVVLNTSDATIFTPEFLADYTVDCCFIEFKLIPASDVAGLVSNDKVKNNTEYVTVSKASE